MEANFLTKAHSGWILHISRLNKNFNLFLKIELTSFLE